MKKQRIIVDFRDQLVNGTCIVKYNNQKKEIEKAKFMHEISKYRCQQAISMKSKIQFFTHENPLFCDVYKYIVLFPSGEEMVIKNVMESDLYFDELEALSKYKARIVLKDDEIYPDFPKETDEVFQYSKINRNK